MGFTKGSKLKPVTRVAKPGPFTSTVVHSSDRYEVKTRRAFGVTKTRRRNTR